MGSLEIFVRIDSKSEKCKHDEQVYILESDYPHRNHGHRLEVDGRMPSSLVLACSIGISHITG